MAWAQHDSFVTAIYIATSNPGKLRDFAAAAKSSGQILPLPGFASFASVEEDGATFAANSRKKAEHYSRHAPHEDGLVLADDSGLEVFALQGEPGVRSARYSVQSGAAPPEISLTDDRLTLDARNNLRLLRELQGIEPARRGARFVCVLAAARQGSVLKTFRGELRGIILESPRGHGGFGYDPLFYVPALGRTMAELSPEERARIGHRGQAFKKFLQWLNRS
jgi:XTP/dITP diphosphohydrolase